MVLPGAQRFGDERASDGATENSQISRQLTIHQGSRADQPPAESASGSFKLGGWFYRARGRRPESKETLLKVYGGFPASSTSSVGLTHQKLGVEVLVGPASFLGAS